MSWIIIEPADPDCPKCRGTGTISESEVYGKYPGTDVPMGEFSFGDCTCRSYANRQKIKDCCEHEFTCKKCGKAHSQ